MTKEILDKLNIVADRIILNEEKCPLDFELQLNMLKKMITANQIKNSNNGVELLLSREEVLKRVLEFYKTIDIEYYSEALDFYICRNNCSHFREIIYTVFNGEYKLPKKQY